MIVARRSLLPIIKCIPMTGSMAQSHTIWTEQCQTAPISITDNQHTDDNSHRDESQSVSVC